MQSTYILALVSLVHSIDATCAIIEKFHKHFNLKTPFALWTHLSPSTYLCVCVCAVGAKTL